MSTYVERLGYRATPCEHCEEIAVCRLRGSSRNIAEWACETCQPEAFKESTLATLANRVLGFIFRTSVLVWLTATVGASVPRSRIAELTIPDLVVGVMLFILALIAGGLVFWPLGGDYSKAYYIWGGIATELIYPLAATSFFAWLLYRWDATRPVVHWLLLKIVDIAFPGGAG
jgi:hypothetical protein